MSAAALRRDGPLGRALRVHAASADPWLRAAAAAGARADDVRAALADLEPVTPGLVDAGDDAEPATSALLDVVRVTLDLVARGRWHAGHPQRAAVLEVLPALTPWCRALGGAVVAPVVAAAAVVGRRGALDRWAALLAAAPPPPSAALVRPALLLAAWRCGLVRYRDAALDAAAGLPADVVRALLALPADADVAAVLDRNRADRWWWPGTSTGAGVVSRAGGFTVWGGPWLTPPRAVAAGPTGWGAVADGYRWSVLADVHGSAVVRLAPDTDEPWGAGPQPAAPAALPVPWTDEVTGAAPDPDDPALVLVSRVHSYALDVVRLAAADGAA
ncbi:hypothetical protein GC089_11285 [Cellulomonas sp. JZ18]|uniref:hypothetical protein n=1 Tax=Cellulomonas sp. JZ18 TaxID=2654191 RepID=UPI0012D3E858|nr:hypothetical protein [Cellulomonas sp. JZ18]QGQ19703.1 hypothetical protein GC089_11285 [Cellulomonas sp. JZ18]